MERIITLTTDFGLKDPYQGAMKGAILSINPGAHIIDITHLVSSGNILEGAFILLSAYGSFPKGTIHVAVVDPGVGGKRKPVLVETEKYTFVGPDNGIFSLISGREKIKKIIHLLDKKFFLKDISNTFHGRDMFAPVAAHLSLGVFPGLIGRPLKTLQALELPRVKRQSGAITGVVIYVDGFGNLITNIKEEDIKRAGRVIVSVKGRDLGGLKKTYSSVERGSLLALIGSSRYLEIAQNNGSAAAALQAGIADTVNLKVTRR